MNTVSDVLQYLETLAPLSYQLDFDNSGLLLGDLNANIQTILMALDITDSVVAEAVNCGAELIVSHHPLIFHPIKNLTLGPETNKLYLMMSHSISAICFHTNLDIVQGGVNDVLLSQLNMACVDTLDQDQCGRIGEYEREIDFSEFLAFCKSALNTKGLRYYSANRPVRRVAVMGGAGAASIRDAFFKGCDTYLTADLRYHDFLLAAELGINLIDGDHFCTENPVVWMLKDKLSNHFPEINVLVSTSHSQIINFY